MRINLDTLKESLENGEVELVADILTMKWLKDNGIRNYAEG